MYVVTVDFMINAAHVASFRDAVRAQARNSLEREPGCHQFDVCTDPAEPRRVLLYEIYTDEAAFRVHLESSHFLSFDATVRDWLESKQVATFHREEPSG